MVSFGGWSSVFSFIGATASAPGRAGPAPAPAAGDHWRVLRGDGVWFGVALPWQLTRAYAADEPVVTNGGMIAMANAAIPANTAFSWGTTGATWRPVLPAIFNWRGVYASGMSMAINDVAVHSTSMASPLMCAAIAHAATGLLVDTTRAAGLSNTGCMVPFLGSNGNYAEFVAIGASTASQGGAGLMPAQAQGTQSYPIRGNLVARPNDYVFAGGSIDQDSVVANTIINFGTTFDTAGNISVTSSQNVVLRSGRSYELMAAAAGNVGTSGDTRLQFYNVTDGAWMGKASIMYPTSGAGNGSHQPIAMATLRGLSADKTIQLRCLSAVNATTLYAASTWLRVTEI
ncbi:hypothetical protein ACQ3G6_13295 [Allorhizobium undicola]|uniref:hypothetical protein n=1 Tax=Allorhizobium undicola TaxID=78527 RepID=UPI003D32FC23